LTASLMAAVLTGGRRTLCNERPLMERVIVSNCRLQRLAVQDWL